MSRRASAEYLILLIAALTISASLTILRKYSTLNSVEAVPAIDQLERPYSHTDLREGCN